jgi:hypothetical protein
MRSAPPVLVPVGRFVWGGRLVLAWAALAALVCLTTVWWLDLGFGRTVVMGVVWLLAAGLSCLAWRRECPAPGELSWDGEAWWYGVHGGDRRQVSVVLGWDAGRAMLLNVRDRQRHWPWGQYIWLNADRMPQQWHGLRCAVHGRDTL